VVRFLGVDTLSTEMIADYARLPWPIEFAAGVPEALTAAALSAADASASAEAYGRTTGVGANRDVAADDADGEHGLRLVRSHATGAGAELGVEVARASMLVRVHQLSWPGSGIPFPVVDALRRAANDGRTPPVRAFGGLGTGDIVPLAELALCLLGERPWSNGETAAYLDHIDASGALSFMSSSAPTIAVAAVAAGEFDCFVRASVVVAALSAAAVQSNGQQWSEVAERTRPSAGASFVAESMRHLLDGHVRPAVRTQDPLSFRTIPFIAGPLWEATHELSADAGLAANAQAENPRFAIDGVFHHGAFQLTSLALRLDTARLALTQWVSTSLARLVKLCDPAYNGEGRFLARGPQGSSGLMVLEYTSASALDAVRGLADPVTRGTTTISIGNEDTASFASRAAIVSLDILRAAGVVVGCELVAAVRALRRVDRALLGERLCAVLDVCAGLPDVDDDRPLVDDVAMAPRLLGMLAEMI